MPRTLVSKQGTSTISTAMVLSTSNHFKFCYSNPSSITLCCNDMIILRCPQKICIVCNEWVEGCQLQVTNYPKSCAIRYMCPFFHDQTLIPFYCAPKVSSYALLQHTMNENICKIEPLFFFLNPKTLGLKKSYRGTKLALNIVCFEGPCNVDTSKSLMSS